MHRFIRVFSPLLLVAAVAFLALHPTIAMSSLVDDLADSLRMRPHRPAPGDRWAALNEVVHNEAERFPGTLSVIAQDLTTGERFAYAAEVSYRPASTMKVAVALCVAQAVQRGDLTWDTAVAYTPDDDDPDEVTDLEEWPYGTPHTVQELVTDSLAYSSNVATHMLIRTLTWQGMLACSQDLGGPVTWGPEGSTPVTAVGVAAWWQGLWDLAYADPAQAAVILQALRNATYTGRIAAGTPAPELVTHKYGSVDDFFHDGAIIWADRPYLLVVLTAGAGEGEADAAIERIAAAAWAGEASNDAAR